MERGARVALVLLEGGRSETCVQGGAPPARDRLRVVDGATPVELPPPVIHGEASAASRLRREIEERICRGLDGLV